ncbi:MAG: putative DNA-binding domain-containing protein [Akkermansiaceae bacterium]|jgi:hypothetical protein|nr:putative DNA-binding domain-containing protein [Akkermansiaceae bacterium]
MSRLEQLQREFFKALLLPLRGSSRKSTELTPSDEGHAPEFFRIADEIIKPGPELSAAERLELYHRQYWFRILDSLAEDFPVLRRMAGDERFWELIEAYLLERPSQSFTLRHLGEAFADHIEAAPCLDDSRRRWFGGIARIEYAFMKCFECAQSALPEAVDLGDSEIELQEHVQLLRLSYPVDLCWGWQDFTPAEGIEPEIIHIAVWREPSGRSRQERLEAGEVRLLSRLRDGIRLDVLFDELPEPTPSEDDITRWFAKWQGYRWLGVCGKEGAQELDRGIGWEGMDRMSSQAVSMTD